MYDGDISGNTAQVTITGSSLPYAGGGGVCGRLTMYGGSIRNNTAEVPNVLSGGGGVYINSRGAWLPEEGVYETVNSVMYGGEISGNIASGSGSGGGVNVVQGTFTLEDGVISGNHSAGWGGGAVFAYNSGGYTGNFTMNGGVITGHSSSYVMYGTVHGTGSGSGENSGTIIINGGRIYNNQSTGIGTSYNYAHVEINGGEISGNTRYGAYIRSDSLVMNNGLINGNGETGVEYSGAEFTLNGGTISNNRYGGVYLSGGGENGCDFTMNGGNITGNTSTGRGAGVRIGSSGITFTMKGGVIAGNTSGEEGGGVYVAWHSAFIKAPPALPDNGPGGVIYGSEASVDAALRNTAKTGDALYWYDGAKKRNTTIGENAKLSLSTDNDNGYGGWE
jgi:hypothetical protein